MHLKPSAITAPDGRFHHVHIDVVGPLPLCQGYRYLVTCIDRFSRWPEAFPTKDISAQTIARVFFNDWIARFGTPKTITSDQGSQFESTLFGALLKLVGCERIRTTAYHPAANGMVERWHRSLKAAIRCQGSDNSLEILPTVLLGLRTSIRLDTDTSPAEFLYGTTLRMPGEFFTTENFAPDPHFFLEEFREHMRTIKPVPVPHHDRRKIFTFKKLQTCSHVFLRTDAVKKPLENPYRGPFKVLERTSDRVFKIDVQGVSTSVSVERLKPAHLLFDEIETAVQPTVNPTCSSSSPSNEVTRVPDTVLKTYARKKKVQFANSAKTG